MKELLKDKERLRDCVLSVLCWGLAAHAYVFFHHSISHDSLNEFSAAVFGNRWKVQIGRVFVPAYRFLTRGNITLPWLCGLLSLVYIAAAAVLICDLFSIRRRGARILLCGILSVNLTVSANLATFLNDVDANMLAMFLAVLALWFIRQKGASIFPAILAATLCLGLYQSYISVYITLLLFLLIQKLLMGREAKAVIKDGILGGAVLAGAALLYLISMYGIRALYGGQTEEISYNSTEGIFHLSLSKLPLLCVKAAGKAVYSVLFVHAGYPRGIILGIHLLLIALVIAGCICRIRRKHIGAKSVALLLCFACLLPLGMNISYVADGGMSHDLMHYAFWLSYVYVLLAEDFFAEEKAYKTIRLCAALLLSIVLFGNIRVANALYLKKDMEYEANQSLFTRVLYEMEHTAGYKAGRTAVVMVGLPHEQIVLPEGFEGLEEITGAWYPTFAMSMSPELLSAYFRYVLLSPVRVADAEQWQEVLEDERASKMPVYPQEGSVQMIDDVMVVRLQRE